MYQKKERMIRVTDNWHPCFGGNKVRLRLSLCYFRHYYVKLSAWGADDTGVEIELGASDLAEANQKYQELEKLFDTVPDGVNRKWFLDNGFTPA